MLSKLWEENSLLIQSVIILLITLPLIYIFSNWIARLIKKQTSEHVAVLVQKSVFFSCLLVVVFNLLISLGFDLRALLGAAGIVSVAIGFAAQTSLSNIISGIFLFWERSFGIGDLIKVGDTTGVVMSIDLMSTKIRTFKNLYVKIPNETLVKAQVTTITRFPIRRLDINIGVAYKEDVKKVIDALKSVAEKNPHCLDEPEALIIFENFGGSSLEFLFAVWFEKSEYLKLKNSIMIDIKECFDREAIEIPFPHTSLYTGSATEAFPIKIVGEQGIDKLFDLASPSE